MKHRVERVSELIRRELGAILERDFRFENVLVTIHDVSPTPDFKQAFVYLGVIGKEHEKDMVLRKLNAGRPAIQRDLYKRVKLRNSPSLVFRVDDSIERGTRVLDIINNLPPMADPAPETEGAQDRVE
ncbi:MAG: 30S ribosome-binding factor RbfA [Verrucomicrobiaceae bacterium]|nr:30S ribosome-binding factor RbfA [Verrucomicrobiaceae bacterium]